jgi:hypothetical protein
VPERVLANFARKRQCVRRIHLEDTDEQAREHQSVDHTARVVEMEKDAGGCCVQDGILSGGGD